MDDEDVRLAVYQSFAVTGRPPSTSDLAQQLGGNDGQVQAALRQLHAARHLVLNDEGSILMAHPFTSVPLGFSVMGRRTLWWGGCAWDSFAFPNLLRDEPEVLVATRCLGCGAPHAWVVGRDRPPPGMQVAHFLTPMAHVWEDVVRSCSNQRIFCSEECVNTWLVRTRNPRGDLFDLATLWRLAQHWYDGRLERGYVRRDPIAAAEYFRSVGLSGSFWGL